MPTTYHKFTGKAKWAKIYDPEEFRGSTNWKIDVYLDKKELKARADAGIQSKVYEDEEGSYVNFKRPLTKVIKGVLNEFHPPKIYDKDGTVLVDYKKSKDGSAWERVGIPVLIGNGSTVEVDVAVYDTQMGKGQRLESIKIIDLIVYEGSGESSNTIVRSTEVQPTKTPW
jgi:hypothetical protein